jgi:hypothetical protein
MAAQPQPANVPVFDSLPPSTSPGLLVSKNGQLYRFGAGGSGGVLWMWQGLGGSGALVGTHSARLASFPASGYQSGTLFFETDRTVVYIDDAGTWVFAAGMYEDVLANRPVDLTVVDEGFLFLATDTGVLYAWNGTALVFIPIGGTSSSLSVRTVTASDSVLPADYTILSDATTASLTISFPAAPGTGRVLNNKKIDASANTVTLDGNGNDIEGGATVVISTPQLSLETQYDGVAWRVL